MPVLRLPLWVPGLRKPLLTGFVLDTGCDYDLVLSRAVRDQIRSFRPPASWTSVFWGRNVLAERYAVSIRIGGVWKKADAVFPHAAELEDSLIGHPLLRDSTVCLRPLDGAIYLARPSARA